MKKPSKIRPRNLHLEHLESREVLAAGLAASLSGSGVLTVTGTDNDDYFLVRQSNGRISVTDIAKTWSASSVKSIVLDLKGGNDTVSTNSFANGGTQALAEKITIKSGAGNEVVHLANWHDVRFNGDGNTLVIATNGVTTLNGAWLNFSSSIQVSLHNGALSIVSTNFEEHIRLRQRDGVISINGVAGSWAASSVNAIYVHLQNSEKLVSLDSLSNGGNQELLKPIMVFSGTGDANVCFANGHDVSFSGWGNCVAVTASGDATFNGQQLSFDDPNPDPAPEPDPEPDPTPPTPNWFDSNIQDAALRSLGSSLYTDGLLDRSDILALLTSAKDGGLVDATEHADLRRIVDATELFDGDHALQTLTSYVAYGNSANHTYQGQALGGLFGGASDAHLQKLVNKWFLGLDRPEAGGTYRPIAGTLFVNGPSYTDVRQGTVGDCYLVAAFAEVALRDAARITSMFTVNGDGTYTVQFFNGSQAYYVTVDSCLPTNSAGNLIYAGLGSNYNNAGNELWVALAEKAYVQLNEFGFVRPGLAGNGENAYDAINGGYIYAALGHVSGRATMPFTMTGASNSFTTFVNAYNAGKMIGFASYSTPQAGSGVVGSHAYAVVGYNASAQTVTLFNPWGTQYGLLSLSWSQIQSNFMYFDRTA